MSTLNKTIRVSSETYDDLAKQGTVIDSFDDVIKRLLKKQEGLVQ